MNSSRHTELLTSDAVFSFRFCRPIHRAKSVGSLFESRQGHKTLFHVQSVRTGSGFSVTHVAAAAAVVVVVVVVVRRLMKRVAVRVAHRTAAERLHAMWETITRFELHETRCPKVLWCFQPS